MRKFQPNHKKKCVLFFVVFQNTLNSNTNPMRNGWLGKWITKTIIIWCAAGVTLCNKLFLIVGVTIFWF